MITTAPESAEKRWEANTPKEENVEGSQKTRRARRNG
jgi:hypothetical protein